MDKKIYVLVVLIAAVTVALLAVAFLPPLPSSVPEHEEGTSGPVSVLQGPAASAAQSSSKATLATPPAQASSQIEPSAAQLAPDSSSDLKQRTLEVIQAAMVTYSEDGLPVLKPYLAHPDPEIRSAAIEAVIQLSVPAGAEVLRQASKTAKNSEEQIKMIQGADFLELPRIPLDLLKQVLAQKSASAEVKQPAPAALPVPQVTGK